jgi:putative addiction module component (TIGR02574 family)
MATTEELIEQVESLPIEERARVVDSVLRTFHRSDPDVDRAWAKVALQRLEELRSGRVKPIPFEDVFNEIRERFPK